MCARRKKIETMADKLLRIRAMQTAGLTPTEIADKLDLSIGFVEDRLADWGYRANVKSSALPRPHGWQPKKRS